MLFGAPHMAQSGWVPEIKISGPGIAYYPQVLVQDTLLHVIYQTEPHIYYVRSSDHGSTWTTPAFASGDTCSGIFARIFAYDRWLLVLWLGHQFPMSNYYNIFYTHSSDFGNTWSSPNYVLPYPGMEDLRFFAAAHDGGTIVNIIFAESMTSHHPGRFYSIRGTRFGLTWGSPVELFAARTTQELDMTYSCDVYHVAWCGEIDSSFGEFYYFRSTDGGMSWSQNQLISPLDIFPSNCPQLAANEMGDIAVIWNDLSQSPYWSGDIFLRRSFDQGQSWLDQQQITISHFAEGTDICWSGNNISIAWEDLRRSLSNIYYIKSTDSGENWGEEYHMGYDSCIAQYPCLAAFGNMTYLTWFDGRANPDTDIHGAIYFTRYQEEPDSVKDNDIMLSQGLRLSSYPNPFNSSTIIKYINPNEKGGEVAIYNLQGQLIKTFKTEGKVANIEWDARDATGNKVSSGIYFAKASNNNNSSTIKLIYLK